MHCLDDESFETEQQCTTVGQARAFLRSGCVRTPSSQGREPSISHRHDPNRSHQTPGKSEEPDNLDADAGSGALPSSSSVSLASRSSNASSAAGKYSRSVCRSRWVWRVRSQISVLCTRETTLI